MPTFERFPAQWQESGVGTISGVTVTHAADSRTGTHHFVSGIQCSGDAAAVVTVESPSGTVLFRKRFAGAFTHNETFPVPLRGAAEAAVLVKISASTLNCEANIQGYTVT